MICATALVAIATNDACTILADTLARKLAGCTG